MTCHPIVAAAGRVIGWTCEPGGYTHLVMARCPWCCLGTDEAVHAFREVHGGYSSPDMLCGQCGQAWTADDDRLRRMAEEEREANIAKVRHLKATGHEVGPTPLPSVLSEPPL
jgi:hypothetical protein